MNIKQNITMKNNYKKRVYIKNRDNYIILSLAILFILIITLFISLAFYSATNQKQGTITLGEIDFSVYETAQSSSNIMPASSIPCTVNVINSRNTSGTNTNNLAPFLLRFRINYTLNNDTYSNANNLILPSLANANSWTTNQNYYYYNYVVNPSQIVNICDNISFLSQIDNTFQSKSLEVIFDIDAIQFENNAYLELWPEAPKQWKDIVASITN